MTTAVTGDGEGGSISLVCGDEDEIRKREKTVNLEEDEIGKMGYNGGGLRVSDISARADGGEIGTTKVTTTVVEMVVRLEPPK